MIASEKNQRSVLLSVENLSLVYRTRRGDVQAVSNVSFSIGKNEVFGLAGESGCGKSTTAFAIAQLHKPPAQITGGKILFDGRDILTFNEDELRAFRWNELSIVTQSAMNALNPVLRVGDQIADTITTHTNMNKKQAYSRARELFDLVGIDPERVSSYPHQLSGGMRQRAVIAMALALNPKLIIMDEPTTALDVVVQKQIIDEIKKLQAKFRFSILFITHDLSLLVEFCDRIGIMYAGELVEIAPAMEIFKEPQHPYANQLMHSFPTIFGERITVEGIPGSPPDLISLPPGCPFSPRCQVAIEGVCTKDKPHLMTVNEHHQAACWHVNEPIAGVKND
jgi:peptide/nickel transport system ATP-binding protein